jgi:hypothetical protein
MHTLPDLPASVARHVFATLCAGLPPPPTGTAEARAVRDEAAMAAVAALRPADAFEARLAAEIVAADAQAMDCFRLASQYCNDLAATLRCRAQAAAMMRQMQSALRTLINMQSMRQKAAAAKQSVAPPKDAIPQPEPQPDLVAAAEGNATMHPDPAATIRTKGGLPARLDFVPPEPAVTQARVDGTSPVLSALGHLERETAAADWQEMLSHVVTQ